jgi:hypothetical protein
MVNYRVRIQGQNQGQELGVKIKVLNQGIINYWKSAIWNDYVPKNKIKIHCFT